MHQTTVSSFLDEIVKIATGLAPAGAPTVNSKGAGLAPKLPKLTGMPKPGAMPGSGPGMPKMGEAFFSELLAVSEEITKEADFGDFKSNPLRNARRGALTLGLGSAAYSGIRHYAKEKKEQAKDMQRNLSPEEQKKAKKKRMIGAAVDTALTGAAGAAIGAGVGKLNTHARNLKAEGRTILGDEIGKGIHGIPGGVRAARAEAKAAKAYETQQRGPKKGFWARAGDNFKENLHNAANHKFASAR
jgi:hypothetical protein